MIKIGFSQWNLQRKCINFRKFWVLRLLWKSKLYCEWYHADNRAYAVSFQYGFRKIRLSIMFLLEKATGSILCLEEILTAGYSEYIEKTYPRRPLFLMCLLSRKFHLGISTGLTNFLKWYIYLHIKVTIKFELNYEHVSVNRTVNRNSWTP